MSVFVLRKNGRFLTHPCGWRLPQYSRQARSSRIGVPKSLQARAVVPLPPMGQDGRGHREMMFRGFPAPDHRLFPLDAPARLPPLAFTDATMQHPHHPVISAFAFVHATRMHFQASVGLARQPLIPAYPPSTMRQRSCGKLFARTRTRTAQRYSIPISHRASSMSVSPAMLWRSVASGGFCLAGYRDWTPAGRSVSDRSLPEPGAIFRRRRCSCSTSVWSGTHGEQGAAWNTCPRAVPVNLIRQGPDFMRFDTCARSGLSSQQTAVTTQMEIRRMVGWASWLFLLVVPCLGRFLRRVTGRSPAPHPSQ